MGRIETTEGVDVFDEEAARSVMEFYKRENVRVPIDLEHDSFNKDARANRSDARDARGYFDLELRADGLYAVNVEWTPDGARRLREKTQRYTSAAFDRDADTGRILRLYNVAITSSPATHSALPLVASRSASNNEVTNALQAALCDAFPRNEADPSSSVYVCDVFPESCVYEREGKLWQVAYTYANGTAQFAGEPVQVVRRYEPVGMRARRAVIAIAERRLARMQTSCQRNTRKP